MKRALWVWVLGLFIYRGSEAISWKGRGCDHCPSIAPCSCLSLCNSGDGGSVGEATLALGIVAESRAFL